MRPYLLASTFFVFLVQASVAADSFENDIRSLEKLLTIDPLSRAKSSVLRGDLRLLGIAGYALDIPGVEKRIEWCEPIRANVNIIEGTSDVVGGQRHIALIERAREYATRYNKVIVKAAHFKIPIECKES